MSLLTEHSFIILVVVTAGVVGVLAVVSRLPWLRPWIVRNRAAEEMKKANVPVECEQQDALGQEIVNLGVFDTRTGKE